MACFFPVDAWRARRLNENGKRPIVFRRADGFDDMHLQVPCGKCDGCAADRAQAWAIRIYHEASLHTANSFLTLTYADAPSALVKKDLQDFFKRARHSYKFRYFACGEYGGQTRRPHYHAIIFGQDFLEQKVDINSTLYTNPHLEEIWSHGHIAIGPVTMASCCYVAGYVNKKIGDKDTFSLMSRRPGIGHDWLTRYSDDIKKTGTVTIEGKELPVPTRYLEWNEDDFEDIKRQRRARFSNMPIEEVIRRSEQLPAKRKNKEAQLKLRGEKI